MQRYNLFRKYQKFYHNFSNFFHNFLQIPVRIAYIRGCKPKKSSLCPFKKSPAVIVSVQPAKFTPQKPKRNNRPAQFTRPGIVKRPRKAKRNREFRRSTNFPYICCVFLPSYRPQRYFDRPAGIRPGGVFVSHQLLCGLFARIRSAKSGRFLQK